MSNQADEHYYPSPPQTPIEVENVDITLFMKITKVKTLDEALDRTATSLGRSGLDGFYVLATDPSTQQQWIIQDGVAHDAETFKEEYKKILNEQILNEQSASGD